MLPAWAARDAGRQLSSSIPTPEDVAARERDEHALERAALLGREREQVADAHAAEQVRRLIENRRGRVRETDLGAGLGADCQSKGAERGGVSDRKDEEGHGATTAGGRVARDRHGQPHLSVLSHGTSHGRRSHG